MVWTSVEERWTTTGRRWNWLEAAGSFSVVDFYLAKFIRNWCIHDWLKRNHIFWPTTSYLQAGDTLRINPLKPLFWVFIFFLQERSGTPPIFVTVSLFEDGITETRSTVYILRLAIFCPFIWQCCFSSMGWLFLLIWTQRKIESYKVSVWTKFCWYSGSIHAKRQLINLGPYPL